MNPLGQTAGILLIVLGAGSGLGYMVLSLVSAFSTLERCDAPGSRDETLEPGDYTRIGVSVAAFRIERKRIYEISASASPDKTLPGGGIAITRGLGFFGVFRLVLTTLALVGGGVGGGLVILLKKPAPPA